MKSFICFLLLVLTPALWAETLNFTDSDGKTYKGELSAVEPDALAIETDSGIIHVPLEKLPADLQKKFNYSPEKTAKAKATQPVPAAGPAPTPELAPFLSRRAKLVDKYKESIAKDKADDEKHEKELAGFKKMKGLEESVKRYSETHALIVSTRKVYYEGIVDEIKYIDLCIGDYKRYLATLSAEDATKVRQAVTAQKWFIGMEKSAFRVIKNRPDKINTTTTARGAREQWVYEGGGYFYFEKDKLASVQD